jgi:uncharacterized protein (TIGR02391 family)
MARFGILRSIAPSISDALELPVEELAFAVFDHVKATEARSRPIHAGNLFMDLASAYDAPLGTAAGAPSPAETKSWKGAIAEAIAWLELAGFLVRIHESNYIHYDISRGGAAVKTKEMFAGFVRQSQVRREALHPTIANEAWAIYLRGKFDAAVFAAFKAIEVAVRKAGKFKNTDIGRDLMNKAFNPDSGPLRDSTIPRPEQEATMHLFSGAIGLFKNPGSHRQIDIDDPVKAAQLLITASHLLGIVDEAIARNGL